MGDHSRRRSRSRSGSRNHDRHRHRDRSRSHHHHSHHESRRDRDRSRSHRRHHDQESRRRRSHSRHSSPDKRPTSVSHSHHEDTLDNGKRNTLKEQLEASLKQSNGETSSAKFIMPLKTEATQKKSIRFDDRGREINEFGEVIEKAIIKPVATLSINRKRQQTAEINPYLSKMGSMKSKSKKGSFDPRIKVGNRDLRGRKALNFVKEGTFTKRAEEIRAQEARAKVSQTTLADAMAMKTDENTEKKEDQPSSVIDPKALPPPPHNPVPIMEWWDYDLLPSDISQQVKEDQYEGEISFDMLNFDNCITKEVIEHPVSVERNKLPPPKALPLMLTKKERKRKRRLDRKQREEAKQDQIQAGLLPKPEIKLTYRNFMQVLGSEATLKPTWADQLVREQIEKRKLAHQLRNEERKLTPQEAAAKRERKIIGDKSGELSAMLFRIESLRDAKQRFKVSVNATQYQLVGRCLIVPSVRCVMVYVEGTKKAIRKYEKLLLQRVKWNEGVPTDKKNEKENDELLTNNCTKLWTGLIKSFHFKDFVMKECDTDVEARQEMAEKSLAQHWDSVINYIPAMNRLYTCLLTRIDENIKYFLR